MKFLFPVLSGLLFFLFSAGSHTALAAGPFAEIDALHTESDRKAYRKALTLCETILAEDLHNFDALWRGARACRWYAELTRQEGISDWKAIGETYGKKGMEYAARARKIAPEKPHGHFYFGTCAAIYADSVSLTRAMREGLKGKTQRSFETVYNMEKHFDKARSILALGRFWAILPWPVRDRDEALRYYREYQKTPFYKGDPEGPLFLAELLIEKGGEKNRAEAKSILQTDLSTSVPYFLNWQARLLQKTNP